MNPSNVSQPPSASSDTASSGGGSLKEKAADTTRKVSETVREKASDLKSAAAQTASRVKDEATHMATEKKERTAEHIESYGSAAHEAANSLESEDPNIAWFTHRAADRLQRVADYVRDRDFTALRGDCEGLARRHPTAFFGGMFIAGLMIGNVLKARRPEEEEETYPSSSGLDRPEIPYGGAPATEPIPYGTSGTGI